MNKSYKLFTDGGSRGNPGKAACAYFLLDNNDKLVDFGGNYLNIVTNNFAEYEGLIRGLSLALKLGILDIQVNMDSELIVNQILGKYKIKSVDLLPKSEEVKKLIKQFSSFSINHIPREQNKNADKLVNIILDNN